MGDEEVEELRKRNRELERLFELQAEEDEVRETEFRSLQLDLALAQRYVRRLERMRDELIGQKDVHIRNLESIIAQLTESRSEVAPPGDRDSLAD